MSLSQDPFFSFLAASPVVGFLPWELPRVKFETGPLDMEGRARPKKEADHAGLVGGRLSKPGNVLTRLVLGGHEISRFPFLLARILEVSIETSL